MRMTKFAVMAFAVFLAALFILPSGVCAAKGPIKIGVIIPKTGIFAETGRVVDLGLKLAFGEIDYKVAGRDIKLYVEDTEGKAATGLSKAKKLVESNGVKLLLGTHSSSVAMAVRDYIDEMEIPLVITSGAVASQLSFQKKSKWLYRGSTMSAQYIIGLPTYLYENLGYKTMVTMAPDYVYGQETLKAVKNEFEKAGGKVIQQMLLPFPTMDFAPFLAKIKTEADCVLADFAGADGVRLVKQYKEYGIWNKLPLTGSAIILDETLPSLGDAAIGIVGSMNYSYNLETPVNKKFAAAFKAKFGERPGHVSPSAYEVARAVILALEKLNGNIEDSEAFLKAIAESDFEGPRGRFHFEPETHSVINTVYIRKVVKRGGELTFDILKKIPDVRASYVKKVLEQ